MHKGEDPSLRDNLDAIDASLSEIERMIDKMPTHTDYAIAFGVLMFGLTAIMVLAGGVVVH